MGITLDHLGIISPTNEHNADIAAFFADVLGLTVTGDAAGGYAEVSTGGPTISLHRGALLDNVAPHGGTLLQFRSDDVVADIAAIQARGGAVPVAPRRTDWGTITAYVAGPHGVLVELYQFA
jgi:predicted enzyme related to lactoylglutathione lyase